MRLPKNIYLSLLVLSSLFFVFCIKGKKAEDIVTVSAAVGEATAITTDSSQEALSMGMVIAPQTKIVASTGARIKCTIRGYGLVYINQNTTVVFDISSNESSRQVGIELVNGELYAAEDSASNTGTSVRITTLSSSIDAGSANAGIIYDSLSRTTLITVLKDTVAAMCPPHGTIELPACKKLALRPNPPAMDSLFVDINDVDRLCGWVGRTIIENAAQASGCVSDVQGQGTGPVFSSVPHNTAIVGTRLIDTAVATASTAIRYVLSQAPAGCTLDAQTGILTFTPADPGLFDVTIRAVDARGRFADKSYTIMAEQQSGIQLRATVTAPSVARAGDTVAISARGSADKEHKSAELVYRFDVNGDGKWDYPSAGDFGDHVTISHVYNKEGKYAIRLEVKNAAGVTATSVRSITVNAPPNAAIAVSPVVGKTGDYFYFDASASRDGMDPPESLAVRWDLKANGTWDIPEGGAYTLVKKLRKSWDTSGTQRICVEVKDRFNATAVICTTVFVTKGISIDALAIPDTIHINDTITMQCTATGQYPIEDYAWNFGDIGTFEPGTPHAFARHAFSKIGEYTIICKVTDTKGFSIQQSKHIIVVNTSAMVSAGGPYNGSVNQSIIFRGSGSDPDSKVLEYSWDFDNDGKFDYTSKMNGTAEHAYAKSGTYTAKFRIITDDGVFSEATTTANVGNTVPKAIAGSDIPAKKGLEILLKGRGTDAEGKIAKYEWDFNGDGTFEWSSADSGFVNHVFTDYTKAILRVTDSDGATACDTLTVVICPDEMELIYQGPFCIDRYEWPNKKGAQPEANATQETAVETCRKTGKRLCSGSDWETACSENGKNLFPYGDDFSVDKCNTLGNTIVNNAAAPSGSLQTCRNAYGVYDMSGNLAEWTTESDKGYASAYGGSWQNGEGSSTCKSRVSLEKGKSYFYAGFRCCK